MKIVTTPTKVELTRAEAEEILSRVHTLFIEMRAIYIDDVGGDEDFSDNWNKLWVGRAYSTAEDIPNTNVPLQVTICG